MKIKAARNSIETDSSDKRNTAGNANTAAGEEKTFLGTEPIGRLLFKLAVPTVIAQLVNMLYNIVDRIYIGHMPGDGSAALTGVGVCMPLILIVSAFAAFVASGGAPRASISMGKGDYDSAEKILGGCVLMQVVISAVLTAIYLMGPAMSMYFRPLEGMEKVVNCDPGLRMKLPFAVLTAAIVLCGLFSDPIITLLAKLSAGVM